MKSFNIPFKVKRVCPFCGEDNTVTVEFEDWVYYQRGIDVLIQYAFPYLSAEEREIIISGICPKCGGSVFSDC